MREDLVGRRVGAILERDENVVKLIGYGVYEGDFRPPGLPELTAETIREMMGDEMPAERVEAVLEAMRRSPLYINPRIRLDSGEVVWGRECWWGSEERIQAALQGMTVVHVRIIRDETGCAVGVEEAVGTA